MTPERFAAEQRRQATRAGNRARNGTQTGYQRELQRRTDKAAAELVERIAADTLPLSERATEYVIWRDADGNATGITPAG